MKTLIDAKAVEEMKAHGQTTVRHNADVLITPQARDMIRSYGMTIEEGCEPPQAAACSSTPSSCCTGADLQQAAGGLDAGVVFNVLKTLADAGLLETLLKAASRADKPYQADYDEAGFKLVHGATVKKSPLETGNPADLGKVNYQEIIGSVDGAGFGCGLITMDNVAFDWVTECQEAYYIAGGAITVTIAGKAYEARPGDAFFMKKGLSCAFRAQGQASAFCVTY